MSTEEHRMGGRAAERPLAAAEEDGIGGYACRTAYRRNWQTPAEAARAAAAMQLVSRFGAYTAAMILADSFP